MSWKLRVVLPDVCHHIVQRGNNKQEVFHCEADYMQYRGLLRTFAKKHKCRIGAYCLMPNHVHLIIRPPDKESLARMMKCLNVCYQRHLKQTIDFSGHVWEGRYYSSPVEEGDHLWTVLAYIDTNPFRARMVADPCDYKHSSALAHEQGRVDHVLTEILFSGRNVKRYRDTLHADALNKRDLARIRLLTQKGFPIGGDSFTSHVASLFGNLRFVMRSKGRPRLSRRKA